MIISKMYSMPITVVGGGAYKLKTEWKISNMIKLMSSRTKTEKKKCQFGPKKETEVFT